MVQDVVIIIQKHDIVLTLLSETNLCTNVLNLGSVQVLHKRIRGEGGSKWPLTCLQGGGAEGGQNFGRFAYVILEHSLMTRVVALVQTQFI